MCEGSGGMVGDIERKRERKAIQLLDLSVQLSILIQSFTDFFNLLLCETDSLLLLV